MAVLRCIAPFAYSERNGVQRVLSAGDVVDSTDPAIKGRESMFEPVEVTAERVTGIAVEQATSAPGEKRSYKKKA